MLSNNARNFRNDLIMTDPIGGHYSLPVPHLAWYVSQRSPFQIGHPPTPGMEDRLGRTGVPRLRHAGQFQVYICLPSDEQTTFDADASNPGFFADPETPTHIIHSMVAMRA